MDLCTLGLAMEIHSLSNCVDNLILLEVVQTFFNLGPILDFCVVDLDTRGHIVTCLVKDGSLHILRNGIRINKLASSTKFLGIKRIW
jgi:DNA damage-binding protein 1